MMISQPDICFFKHYIKKSIMDIFCILMMRTLQKHVLMIQCPFHLIKTGSCIAGRDRVGQVVEMDSNEFLAHDFSNQSMCGFDTTSFLLQQQNWLSACKICGIMLYWQTLVVIDTVKVVKV